MSKTGFVCACVWLILLCHGSAAIAQDSSKGTPQETSAPLSGSQFVISYLMFDDDEHYRPRRAYTGLEIKQPRRPLDGVRLALKESGILGRSLGLEFALDEISVNSTDDYLAAVDSALASSGSTSVVLDVPRAAMQEVINHYKGRGMLFFNARHPDDDLRQSNCAEQLFHTIPSNAMITDALVQFLITRNWKNFLVLEGPLEADLAFSAAFTRSAKKFGGKIVGTQEFILSNNPRDRSQTNISIMTGGPAYDAVFIADTYGEFARYVPYQTYLSRLVVGSEGLMSDAWHRTWERHGAPQLNQRFDRLAKRRMSAVEWAGWAAARSLTTAVSKTRSTDLATIEQYLKSPELTLDLYKGAPGNYRSWNNQLRQPILLHTHTAVVERAPMDAFLHRVNNLDSLGIDEAESDCQW